MIVQSRIVSPRPSGLARGVDLQRKTGHIETRAVIQPEIALMDQDEARVVAVEGTHRRIFVFDPIQIAATIRIGGTPCVGHALDRGTEYWIDVGCSHNRRDEGVVIRSGLDACARKLSKSNS